MVADETSSLAFYGNHSLMTAPRSIQRGASVRKTCILKRFYLNNQVESALAIVSL